MSQYIRGITFAEQSVTPTDDAIVRRAILGDGILTGCEISYSGSTLTMAPGYIIACGRAFQITAAQNWAVVDATSGFARLLVTLDLTKTATEETFGQIEFSLEYAAAEDGFLNLVQEDINLSGAKYQIVAAVVSLGTGGITGIVSKLERAEGGGLNFKVVAGLTQPVSATENTIWVKTEKMTGWVFDAHQPENLTDGMVWIIIGDSSDFAFNALRKNGLQVYPFSAKQNVGGKIINLQTKIYQTGEWVDWYSGELYWEGNEFIEVTGGWQARAWASDDSTAGLILQTPELTKTEKFMSAVFKPNGSGVVEIAKDVSFDGYKTLNVETSDFSGTGANISPRLIIVQRSDPYWYASAAGQASVMGGVSSIPLDGLQNDKKYDVLIGCSANSTQFSMKIHKIWRE